MLTETMRTRGRVVLLALALLAVLVGLAWPGASTAPRVTWDRLLAPHAPGSEIVDGWVLAPGQHGVEHDVVFVARRAATPGREASSVEIHVLDRGRWTGVIDTESFSIGYELGRSRGSREELAAVTTALAEAIAANDPGGLGSPESIPFDDDGQVPTLARILVQFEHGPRGWALALVLVGLCLTLARVDARGWTLALALSALALMLRGANLDVPFVHDQDVQRAITGTVPLRGHLAGDSLHDRHPPLYFIVLHFVQRFGQSEALLRAPAVLAGASLPALMIAIAGRGRTRIDHATALAALLVATAPPLVAASREVSELPLFAAILLMMLATTLWASEQERPSRSLQIAVALLHGLALWTYYLAPVVIACEVLALVLVSRFDVLELGRPLAVGVLLGSPALVFAGRILLLDRGARLAAEANPDRAWGDWDPLSMGSAMLDLVVACTGSLVVVLLVGAVGVAIRERQREALVFAVVGLGTALGIAMLTLVARIQPYYLLCAVPLLLLSLGAYASLPARYETLAVGGLGLAVAGQLVAALPSLGQLYQPSRQAFVAEFASVIKHRPEQLVITVSHYDATLLAYYLAREHDVPLTTATLKMIDERLHLDGVDVQLHPLVRSHGLEPGVEDRAVQVLREESRRSILVLSRDDFHLEPVARFVSHCELLRDSPGGQLHRCGPPPE